MRSLGLRGAAENPAALAANQERRLIVGTERYAGDTHLLVGTDLRSQFAWQTLAQQCKSVTRYRSTSHMKVMRQ